MPQEFFKKILLLAFVVFLFLHCPGIFAEDAPVSSPEAGNIQIILRANHPNLIYKLKEKAEFTVDVLKDKKSLGIGKVHIVITHDGGDKLLDNEYQLGKKPVKAETYLQDPGFMRCEVFFEPPGEQKYSAVMTVAYEPTGIEPYVTRPEDFMKFWEEGRALLAQQPLGFKAQRIDGFFDGKQDVYLVSFATGEQTRLYGYLSVPNEEEAVFPILVRLPPYGIDQPQDPSWAVSWGDRRVIALDMGIHSIEPGVKTEFQKKSLTDDLQGYEKRGAPDVEAYYFRRVILGLDRVIHYLQGRTDFDGEHLVLTGTSQGGGLAIILAGLNPKVSGVAAEIPAFGDLSGIVAGRPGGWPNFLKDLPPTEKDKYLNFVSYYDAIYFAEGVTASVLMGTGYLDTTCPPSSVYAIFNALLGSKTMQVSPTAGHEEIPAFQSALDPWLKKALDLK